MDHVVHFDTVDKLGVVSQLGLHSVKLGVKFLQVREGSEMHSLDIVADVFVVEEVLDDLMAQSDFLRIRCRLFEPLFQQTGADLSSSLVQHPIQTASLTGHSRLNTGLLWEDIETFEGGHIQAQVLTQSVFLKAELLLSCFKLHS